MNAIEPKMRTADEVRKIYSTQWIAHYKKGLGSPTIVYGETEEAALKSALAEFRRTGDCVSNWPCSKVVDRVEPVLPKA